jgi:DNA-directed RNA polymerase specialized sigma24 family protein
MSEDATFHSLIGRVRGGDQAAATELVRRFEPAIRRAVRFRLAGTGLGAVLDSMDICQSVLASFFVRAAAGQYEISRPEQLLRLLVTMARNKLASQARKEAAERRDHRRPGGNAQAGDLPAPGSSPSQQVSDQDLLQAVYRRLSRDELALVELRNQGHDWTSIAAQLGGNSVVLRKKLSRALNRVSQQLGLDEDDAE